MRAVGSVDVAERPQATESDIRHAPRRKHFYTWVATDQKQLQQSERLVLRGLPYHQARIAGLNTISTDDIRHLDEWPSGSSCGWTLPEKKDGFMTGLEITRSPARTPRNDEPVATDKREVVVLVHGFAGGVAGWAQNWEFFAERYRVYAIDLPGFARSEREPIKAHTLEDAMAVTTGYLERWCQTVGFTDKVNFVGHSFGCFVCAHFAMRCPQYVKVLGMTEPWGINPADPERLRRIPLIFRLLVKAVCAGNPLAMLRALGPAGPSLMKAARPDFSQKWIDFLGDSDLMYDYLYHCNALSPATGENLFRVCCHCDVASKEPLCQSLPQGLGKQIPVGILFGSNSWISSTPALAMADEMRTEGFAVHTDTVSNAGHQIFTDNVTEFNEKLQRMLQLLLPHAVDASVLDTLES